MFISILLAIFVQFTSDFWQKIVSKLIFFQCKSNFGCSKWVTPSTDHLQLLLSSSALMSLEFPMTFFSVQQKKPLSKCQSSFPYKRKCMVMYGCLAQSILLGKFGKNYISGPELNSEALQKLQKHQRPSVLLLRSVVLSCLNLSGTLWQK